MKDRAGRHGSHISHSEDLLAQELLLDVRENIQIVLIGGEQVFEAGVLESKDLVEVLFRGPIFRRYPFSKYVYYFQHDGKTGGIFLDLFRPKAF
jgi:hypothetical protein